VIGQHLVERGHRVTLMVTANTRRFGTLEYMQNGIRIIEAPDLLWGKLRSGWDLWSLLNRTAYLRKEKPDYDLVHCFETRPATIHPGLYFARKYNLPLFSDWIDWWGRGGIIDVLRPLWYRIFFGWYETYYEEAFRPLCDGTTAISSALARRAEALGIAPERVHHLPGGVIPGEQPNRTKEECRRHCGLSLEDPVLGFASADSYLDLDIVMASLAIVAREFPSVKLIVTGMIRPSVMKLAAEYGVQDRILLTGFVSHEELNWWLGCSDVFLLPFPDTVYNNGRWPNKVGHYMCMERPIVANPYGDVKSLLEEHRVGLAADVTPEDFACKIVRLLNNPGLAHQLGCNGRRTAETYYDWTSLIVPLEQFYFRVLDMEKVPRHRKWTFG
jgi:glycosyltransferase involved in cell wall biosynthesis